jgi:signal transduction histidine kinase
MQSLANALPRPVRPHGWGVLLPVVMLAAFCCWGVRPWTGAVLLIAAGVTLLVPAFAADLVPVALIGFGMYACGLATRFSPLPPGSPTSVGYPLHTWLFGESDSHVGIDMTAGIVMLMIGAFLVPRTIGTHSVLAQRNGELVSRVRRLTATRVDAVDTAAAELRRVERDLHDGAQARLVALGIALRATERLIPANPDAALALVAEVRENSAKALAELRALVRGINPPVLAERGLADAIRALALDCPVPTTADIGLPGPLSPPIEAAVYFAVAEVLANAARHAGARNVHIRAAQAAGGPLRIEVTDDGAGGADPARGTGLRGIERRLGTFDGVLAVSSPPGGPTIVVIEVPCALSSAKTSSC